MVKHRQIPSDLESGNGYSVTTSHNLTVLSSDPEASREPLGVNATDILS